MHDGEAHSEAARAARAILAKHWDGVLPVDVHRIAREMGVEVRLHDFPDDTICVSGYIAGKPAILLSSSVSKAGGTRAQFSVAHALGHIELHKDNLEDLTAAYGVTPGAGGAAIRR